MLDIRINSIASTEATVLHRDVALEQSHIDFLIGKLTVDDIGFIDHPPHGPPGIVDDLASIQNDVLGGVLRVLSILGKLATDPGTGVTLGAVLKDTCFSH